MAELRLDSKIIGNLRIFLANLSVKFGQYGFWQELGILISPQSPEYQDTRALESTYLARGQAERAGFSPPGISHARCGARQSP